MEWGGREVWSAVQALQDGLIETIGFSARATLMIQDAVPGKEATSDRCLCILRVRLHCPSSPSRFAISKSTNAMLASWSIVSLS